MLKQEEIPSVNTLQRVVAYVAAVVALGVSFSFTLELMNTEFAMGTAGTLGNVFLSLWLFRYIAKQHFINQDS